MMKVKAMARRQLLYGFCSVKNEQGQVVGSSTVRLARRNAYELIGLRRPQITPWLRLKAS
jgi:hypothetical protein